MEPLLELRNVEFRYHSQTVLEGINLHLQRGQFAAIVGPSGAGKTSLLKLILGALQPSSGQMLMHGRRYDGASPTRVAYVPQIETVDWNFPVTVEQVVFMGRVKQSSWRPWPTRQEQALVRQTLGELGIENLARKHIRDLSGGQQQRVFLARALIAAPELLVLDEPTTGIDMHTTEEILHLLGELNRSGMSILMTTHDINAAANHVPWIVCLNKRLTAQGSPETVFTPENLEATYGGEFMVVRHQGVLFIQQKPHGHSYHDLIPHPVPGAVVDSATETGNERSFGTLSV